MRIDWSHPDVIARFTALHNAGASHEDIRADPLFAGATKGQLSGGRHRLGLKPRDHAQQIADGGTASKAKRGGRALKPAKANANAKAPAASEGGFNPGRPIPASPEDVAAARARGYALTAGFDADTPPPGFRRLLDEGGEKGCRWPVTVDGVAWFCCAPRGGPGGSYCEGHRARAYTGPGPVYGAKSSRAHIARGGRA